MDASQLIDERIKELSDWRGQKIAYLRKLIHDVCPEISEEWKWGSPIFSYHGMVCSLGSFKDHVKVHFFQGAAILDSDQLFNAGLEAKGTRGIDLFEKDVIAEEKLKELLKRAVQYNKSKS